MPHRIHINDDLEPYDFDEAEACSILEFLEASGVEMNSHCRAGFCGTCRVLLERGEVHYPGGAPLGYIREGEILPCCSVPKSDIEIRSY